MKILIAGNTASPFENEFKIHYSIYKSFGLAKGFSNLGHEVFYVSRLQLDKIHNIQMMPYSKIDFELLESFDIIILGLDLAIEKVIDSIKPLKNLMDKKAAGIKTKTLLVIKHATHNWISKSKFSFDYIYKAADFFFCQEIGFMNSMKKVNGDPQQKVFYSEMGTEYVKDNLKDAPFLKRKHNLIYMGRMMHSPSKMPFLIDVMNNFSEEYHLNILPGSFAKPPEMLDKLNLNGKNKFGPEVSDNLQWLKKYFSKSKNITVHKPVSWGEHWNYLINSDLGIDLSPSWSKNKSSAGNAKLLEYLTVGLPVITEISTGNTDLIKKANAGIIVENICNIREYTDAIKVISKRQFDKENISKITIKNNSWNLRAQDMLKNMRIK
jgi:glycosyltransferase involved in cell wall biosynthesis